jgi:hypothetical protein
MNGGEHGIKGAWARLDTRLSLGLTERSPAQVAREVMALTFRGSRAELERAAALRVQATIVLLFLAVRCLHLGQAGIDLALAGHRYTVGWLAIALAVACLVESIVLAAVTLGARRLTARAMLGDAAFGLLGLAVMSIASSSGPERTGSLNWMLPYTVATAAGLGTLAVGDFAQGPPAGGHLEKPPSRGGEPRRVPDAAGMRPQVWPLIVVLGLGAAYVASAYLPHRLAGDRPADIRGNALNYLGFFAAGVLTIEVTRRQVLTMSRRNAEVTAAAATVAREAQWRAVVVDVFGPVQRLLDRIVELPDGELPRSVKDRAGRLITMIDAIRPGDADRGGERSEEVIADDGG